MDKEKLGRFWLLSTFLLIAIIIASGLLIWKRQGGGQPIEISTTKTPEFNGEIYLDGAISRPGIYPWKAGDSIESLLQASGGTSQNADFFRAYLYIPKIGEASEPQKVDINRAEVWLLEALPEIGNTRALAIVQYRQQNGQFHNIEELTDVPGISSAIFEKIKDLVTLSD